MLGGFRRSPYRRATSHPHNPTLPLSKYFGITPTNAQTSLLRHKEGNPCTVSIFRYHVCIFTRPSRIEKNRDGPTKSPTIPVEVM